MSSNDFRRCIPLFSLVSFALVSTCVVWAQPLIPVVAPAPALQQVQGQRGAIYGVIRDHSGAVVVGATVWLRRARGIGQWQAVTNSLGEYRMDHLEAGDYRLSVLQEGFSAPEQFVNLSKNQQIDLPITLGVATVVQQVSVTALPGSTGLTAAMIREGSARDLGGALAGLAGVEMARKAGIANDIAIRGMLHNNIATVIDGTRLFGAGTSQMDPAEYHVDLSEIDHVDLVRGPFDVTTSGVFGGYVKIITKNPDVNGFSLHGNVSTGSYGYYNPSAVAQFGADSLHFLAGYSYRTSEFYKDGRGQRVSNLGDYRNGAQNLQAFRTQSGWTKLAFHLTPHQSGELSYARQQSGNVLYPYLMMDGVYDYTDRALARYSYESGSRWLHTLEGEIYLNKVNHLMDNHLRQSAGRLPATMSTHGVALTDGARAHATLGDGFTAGYAFYRRYWDARGSMWMQGMTMGSDMGMGRSMSRNMKMATHPLPDTVEDVNGAYLTYRHALGARLLLTSGGRYGYSSAHAREAMPALYEAYHQTHKDRATASGFSGNVRLSWQANPLLTFFAGVGSAIRFPDTEELFYASDRLMGASTMTAWVGNPNLRRPRDTEYDYSFTLRNARFSFSPLFYFSDLRNYITLYSASRLQPEMGVDSMRAQSYANLQAHQWGEQLTGSAYLGQGLSMLGSLTFDRGTKKTDQALDIKSPNLFQVPPLTSHLRLRYQRGALYSQFGATVTGPQNHVDTDVHEQATAGYSVFNLMAGYTGSRFHAEAGFDNLFAHQYTQFLSYARNPYTNGQRLPSPGRNFFVNLSYTFHTPRL